jgi:hypothetical protein
VQQYECVIIVICWFFRFLSFSYCK